MDLFNFRDWILEHFKLRVSDNLCDIYFQFDHMVPPYIYDFDTYQTWEYFYRHIICNTILNKDRNCDGFFRYIIMLNIMWEKLYYVLGKHFFLFFFLECRIYFKWGENTYILLSNNGKKSLTKTLIPPVYYEVSTFSVFEEGFDSDVIIDMHRILFSTFRPKNRQKMISQEDPTALKGDVLNQYVGPEISRINAFGKKQFKCLKTLIINNPTLKECESVLDRIVQKQDNIVTTQKVILFLTVIIERYIPYKLLFQRKFLNKFIKNMQQFMKFNTKQKLTLGFVMKGIAEKQDPLKRNVIAKITKWMINDFLINIIRSLFYVTIKDKGNALMFVKLKFWMTERMVSICKLISNNQILEVNDQIKVEDLKHIKFYPKCKGSSYRPVITKSKSDRLHKDKFELCNLFLKQLIATKKKTFPNPVKELHTAWLNYMKMKSRDMDCYFVKTDIKDAYGSIIHSKLKIILEEWCNGLNSKLILVTFEYKGKWGKIEKTKQFLNLTPSAGKILECKPGTDEIIRLSDLKSHIFNYIDNMYVAFLKKNYKIIKGVPQGGKLSAALCEIYYTSMDHNYLSQMSDSNKGDILLRAVDDYIFISQNQEKIKEFLELMTKGIPEYGMEIQKEKTVTNIGEFKENKLCSNSNISFFGYELDLKHGYISPCMKNYQDINIKSTISFNKLNKSILLQKMSSTIALKLHPLLFDHKYQSIRTLLNNIHCASCVMALKFTAIIQLLKLANVILEDKYLLFCIEKATSAIASCVYRKGKKEIQYSAIKKMSMKSFILILKRKKYNFKLLEVLQLKASRFKVKSKRVDRHIKSVGKVLHQCLSYSLYHN